MQRVYTSAWCVAQPHAAGLEWAFVMLALVQLAACAVLLVVWPSMQIPLIPLEEELLRSRMLAPLQW